MVLSSFIAARTRRIRIGLAARILPLHHPLDVAADAAMLDVLSGGRFDLGLARSSMDAAPHEAYGVSRQQSWERFDEAFEVLRLALLGRPFSFSGKHYCLENVNPQPGCVQRPHPPIYLVANSPAAIEASALGGHPVFLNGALRTTDVESTLGRFRKIAACAGHDASAIDVPVNRFIFVGTTQAHAERMAREAFLPFLNGRAPDLKAALVNRFGPGALDPEFLMNEICVFGDAATVTRRLDELAQRCGVRHLLCTLNLITLEHGECLASMRRFARDVMPALRDRSSFSSCDFERLPAAAAVH